MEEVAQKPVKPMSNGTKLMIFLTGLVVLGGIVVIVLW